MKFAVSAALLALAFSPVLAAPAPVLRYIDSEYDANVAKGLRLVKLGQDIEPSWVTEEDKLEFVRAKTGFVSKFRCECEVVCTVIYIHQIV